MVSLCNKKILSESIWHILHKVRDIRVKHTRPKNIIYDNITAITNTEMRDVFEDYFEKEMYVKAPDTMAFCANSS
jgi:hypothetical protein